MAKVHGTTTRTADLDRLRPQLPEPIGSASLLQPLMATASSHRRTFRPSSAPPPAAGRSWLRHICLSDKRLVSTSPQWRGRGTRSACMAIGWGRISW
jgi:hypothetical protein